MKKLLFFLFLWSICGDHYVSAYRQDEWKNGEPSDRIVREQRYTYYFCNEGKCFAVNLNSQEKTYLLQILGPYKDATVGNTLQRIKTEPDLQKFVEDVLRDFKDFRKIDSVDTILNILEGK